MSHTQFMARAIALAKKGLYSTDPNPRVGCVLVKNGKIVGEGYHQKAGEGHAEVNALREAGDLAKGATAYVTLEPCSHFGRTPPCSDGLIKAGVSEVVCAMQDPNPQVAGQGFAKLEAAGISVTQGVLEEQARLLNPGFIKRMETGMPFVRLKMASSLDGRTAMKSGESKWITGPDARADVQRLRARSSAVISGISSVLYDDPSLTVRAEELGFEDKEYAEFVASRQPLRVILDSHGRLPKQAKVLQQSGETLVAVKHGVQVHVGADVIPLDADDSGLDLSALLKELANRQCNEVLVETGATLAGQFIDKGLVDEMVLFMAPSFMGSEARPLLTLPIEDMTAKHNLNIVDTRMVGNDIRLTIKF